MNSDFTVELKTNNMTVHSIDHEENWDVTLAYTGELTMTGGRVRRAAAKYLGEARHFAVTYGDGVTDANLGEEFRFHLEQGRKGTVLGVNPPSRFGELRVEEAKVEEFSEKPEFTDSWINGGYFFFERRIFCPIFLLTRIASSSAIRLFSSRVTASSEHVQTPRLLGLRRHSAPPGISEQGLGIWAGTLGCLICQRPPSSKTSDSDTS